MLGRVSRGAKYGRVVGCLGSGWSNQSGSDSKYGIWGAIGLMGVIGGVGMRTVYAEKESGGFGVKGVVSSFEKFDFDAANAVSEAFVEEIRNGYLSRAQSGARSATSLKLIDAMVPQLPTGSEKGRVFVIDVGGSTVRGLVVDLKGGRHVELGMSGGKSLQSEDPAISHADRSCDDGVDAMYRRFVRPLKRVVSGLDLNESEIPVGFTFSFPTEQTAIADGRLLQWTKSWQCDELVDASVVAPLVTELKEDADLGRASMAALVNDTVGVLMLARYRDPSTIIGLVMGTGTNAAFVDTRDAFTAGVQAEALRKAKKQGVAPDGATIGRKEMVVVNSEWGGFGDKGGKARELLLRNVFDEAVDTENGAQPFEKMISGEYLGPIARAALVHLVVRGELFRPHTLSPTSSFLPDATSSFDTRSLFDCVRDVSPQLNHVRVALERNGVPDSTLEERRKVQQVCEAVGRRAARLTASAIAGIIKHREITRGTVGVGVDGSVFRKNDDFSRPPHVKPPKDVVYNGKGYDGWVQETLQHILPSVKVKFIDAGDGSGIGAAVVAAAAHSAHPTH